VAVEGADADAGPARDLFERSRLAAFGEGFTGGGEHLLVVAPGVGALGALDEGLGGGFGGRHGNFG
jgi:hypothetical protein